MESEVARLLLQIVGVMGVAVGIGLLLPFSVEPDNQSAVENEGSNSVFP